MARRSFASDNTMATIDSEKFPELSVVDLDSKDPNAVEIEYVDDTPEEDRGRPNAKRFTADDDEDLSGYADKTRKRIERLKFETHSERRLREAAERERDEAIRAAQTREQEIADLRRRLDTGNSALANSMVTEREAKITDAKRRLAAAHADGDSEAIAAATADISVASAELSAIRSRMPKQGEERQSERQERQPEQRQEQPRVDIAPGVMDWIAHNRSWFNKDAEKTQIAVGIGRAVEAAGIKPSDPRYTSEVDKRLKKIYPDHQAFNSDDDGDDDRGQREPRRSYGGEPTGRVQETRETSNPRKVTLTATQRSLAKKLGLTDQQYAASLIQYQAREKGKGA